MPTLPEIIAAHNVHATATWGAPESETFPQSDPWTVRLTRRVNGNRRALTVPFYMGRGHNGKEPTAADVLACLISDAASVRNARGFEDWCADLGYDEDSRKAEATYRACERVARKLDRFLGEDFDAFADAAQDY